MQKRIILLLPVIAHPRFLKRIDLLLELGYTITVLYFDRQFFTAPTSIRDPGITYTRIDHVEHGNYLKRFKPILKAIRKLKNNHSTAVVYAFSVDLLLAAVLAGKSRIIYEIGDIREGDSALFKMIYSMLLKKCSRIIVTSDKFGEYLNHKYHISPEKIFFQPHLLQKHQFDPESRVTEKKLQSEDALHIGFVGILRYTAVSVLLEKAFHNRYLKISVFGKGEYEEDVSARLNPSKDHFHGEFNYPDDLHDIYNSIDLNFVMYDTSDVNVKMALPNKLYESIFFATPLIVSSGTYLAEIVLDLKIGITWDYENIDGLCKFLSSENFREKYPDMISNIINVQDDRIFQSDNGLKAIFQAY